MSILVYSLIGVAALIAISFLFTYLGIRRNNKLAGRIARIRKAVALAPDQLLFTPKNSAKQFIPLNDERQNRETTGFGTQPTG